MTEAWICGQCQGKTRVYNPQHDRVECLACGIGSTRLDIYAGVSVFRPARVVAIATEKVTPPSVPAPGWDSPAGQLLMAAINRAAEVHEAYEQGLGREAW